MKPFWTNGLTALYHADARAIPLPDKSVHCCVTSPPYWGLRNYGLGEWDGGDPECSHKKRLRVSESGLEGGALTQNHAAEGWLGGICGHCGAIQAGTGIGLEPTLNEWVQNIVIAMREVKRVLRDDGTLWLNLGDAFDSGTSTSRKPSPNTNVAKWQDAGIGNSRVTAKLGAKNLLGQPWRVAFALQGEGWVLRTPIIWFKDNPVPDAAKDRPGNTYETIFLLTKSNQPTFWTHRDQGGARVRPAPDHRWVHKPTREESPTMPEGWHQKRQCPTDGCSLCEDWRRFGLWSAHDYFYDPDAVPQPATGGAHARRKDGQRQPAKGHDPNDNRPGTWVETYAPSLVNLRNVWRFPVQGRPGLHHATFPDELPRRCVLLGTSEYGVCADCGAPWARATNTSYSAPGNRITNGPRSLAMRHETLGFPVRLEKQVTTTGWRPTCGCNAGVAPAIVLDPFVGSGTTVAVAQSLGRQGIGIDLKADYLETAVRSIVKMNPTEIPPAHGIGQLRVIVCGGRNFQNNDEVSRILDQVQPDLIIHGAARGADTLAQYYAVTHNIPHHPFPAQWQTHDDDECGEWCKRAAYCRLAGPRRNAQMLRGSNPTMVVAFPGGNGTAHMVKIAREAGLPVIQIPATA